MNRSTWASGKGEPFALAEISMILITFALAGALAVYHVTGDPVLGVGTLFFAYLVMDRVRIILDWARGAHRARVADRRMAAELDSAPVRAHMPVRPVA